MANPDGVIYGNSRCNFAGYDLNRHWGNDVIK
jgi:murein tripeptide amidase MpaA